MWVRQSKDYLQTGVWFPINLNCKYYEQNKRTNWVCCKKKFFFFPISCQTKAWSSYNNLLKKKLKNVWRKIKVHFWLVQLSDLLFMLAEKINTKFVIRCSVQMTWARHKVEKERLTFRQTGTCIWFLCKDKHSRPLPLQLEQIWARVI